jgi:cellulose synthase (UDP-forming)
MASMVHAAIHVPRILPTVFATLFKPHGHAFKVTPKGSAAGSAIDTLMVYIPLIIILVTALGLYLNMSSSIRIIEHVNQIPMLATWSIASMMILSVVQTVAISPSGAARSERFEVDLPCVLETQDGQRFSARATNISMSGVGLQVMEVVEIPNDTKWISLELPEVGTLAAAITRQYGSNIGVAFDLPAGPKRDILLQILFTRGMDNSTHTEDNVKATRHMLASILRSAQKSYPSVYVDTTIPPLWLAQRVEGCDTSELYYEPPKNAA